MPRNTPPTPSGSRTPNSASAFNASGINPSPQALSIGGCALSTSLTRKPRRRAAIAAASPAGPPPTTSTSVSKLFSSGYFSSQPFSSNDMLYQRSSTTSEQKPGPIAAITPRVPVGGRRCAITSSSTHSTEADDRFPILRRQSHDTCNSPSCSPNASCVASSTFGPPVCSTQLPTSARVNPCFARPASTSPPKCSRTTLGTSRDSTMEKPFSETSQPITSSVLG